MASLRSRVVAFATRALFLASLGLAGDAFFVPGEAQASVSIQVGFDALVKDADAVVVITPVDATSVWEDGRIYTYTRVKVSDNVAGDVGVGAERTIRTMGGVVGKIGQMVDGEPVFVEGKQSMLFMRRFKTNDVFEVSARGQGQYPVKLDEVTRVRRVIKSTTAGLLVPPRSAKDVATPGPLSQSTQTAPQSLQSTKAQAEPLKIRLASDVIHDRPLDEAAREIATAWRRLHPPPAK